jgi:uncharacterized protein (DUF362 family)
MSQPAPTSQINSFNRRTVLLGGSLAAAGLVGYPLVRDVLRGQTPVFIARNQSYSVPLRRTIEDALLACGLEPNGLRAKRVLLKPNLVEPTRASPHMTTHPAVILAAAETFRGWGAEVAVGEGPGHVRDTEMALVESGVQEALDSADLPFADLNYEEIAWVKNRGRASELSGFFFPRSVVEADLVVSMPKMKTHHWVGVTAAMKNLYGVIPGIKYGWPKNVLHHAGIPETVFDINASLPNTISIVDGIDCMEGDGPILGTRKHLGVIVAGLNLPAVDATVCRMMGLLPERISYLRAAANRLGPVAERFIAQRGECWERLVSPFEILDKPHLRVLRAAGSELVT